MIRWELLDVTQLPDDGGELRLMRRGTEYAIMSGAIELMNSRLSGSEEALAILAAERLASRAKPRVLIGGLGMGFTLRAALAAFPSEALIQVAELAPQVAAWARGPLAAVFAGCLDDPRVRLEIGDVAGMIAEAQPGWDAILLDVDNGPEGLSRKANDRLYDPAGLAMAKRALTPGGSLAVWSSAPNDNFTARLERAGYEVEVARVRASNRGRGARHVIWLARKP
jgi:spermidine synthase